MMPVSLVTKCANSSKRFQLTRAKQPKTMLLAKNKPENLKQYLLCCFSSTFLSQTVSSFFFYAICITEILFRLAIKTLKLKKKKKEVTKFIFSEEIRAK